MKKFLRENLMIVVSIALPLLVALFFIMASVLPGLWSTPPEHDLLLSLQGRTTAKPSHVRIELVVEHEQLNAVAVNSENPNYDNNPRLFRYSHSSGEVSEISIPIPENIEVTRIVDDVDTCPEGQDHEQSHEEERHGRKILGRLFLLPHQLGMDLLEVVVIKLGSLKSRP